MGQYYKPTSLDKKQWVYTHNIKKPGEEFGCGLKLMEHSYINNPVMNAVESLLIPDGGWYKTRIVWAGDYADHEEGQEKTEEGYDVNIYRMSEEWTEIIPPYSEERQKDYPYLTNHTKKEVLDLRKVKETGSKEWASKVHPLSLYTCEGNGRGGGDYRKDDPRTGTWARDVISLEKTKTKGYKLVDSTFEYDS